MVTHFTSCSNNRDYWTCPLMYEHNTIWVSCFPICVVVLITGMWLLYTLKVFFIVDNDLYSRAYFDIQEISLLFFNLSLFLVFLLGYICVHILFGGTTFLLDGIKYFNFQIVFCILIFVCKKGICPGKKNKTWLEHKSVWN